MPLEAATAANQIDNRIFRIGVILKCLERHRAGADSILGEKFDGDFTTGGKIHLMPHTPYSCAFLQKTDSSFVDDSDPSYWDAYGLTNSGIEELSSPSDFAIRRLHIFRSDDDLQPTIKRDTPVMILDSFPKNTGDLWERQVCGANARWGMSNTESPLRHPSETTIVNVSVDNALVGNVCDIRHDVHRRGLIERIDEKLVALQTQAYASMVEASQLNKLDDAPVGTGNAIRALGLLKRIQF